MSRAAIAALIGAAAAMPGCLKDSAYHCSSDSQCGAGGICEPSVLYCSFPDSSCGRRFGDASGPYSNQCVSAVGDAGIDSATPIDGRMVDAKIDAPIDAPPQPCPSSYITVSGQTHVYMVITTGHDWMTQRAACTATSSSAYLAIPDDATELAALDGLMAGSLYWVGVDDITTEGSFVTVKGAAASFLPWAPGEPDNKMNSDCVKVISASAQFDDEKCNVTYPAICECDPP